MSEQPETLLKKKAFKLFDKLPNTWYEKISQVAVRGISDIIMCINGLFIGIEMKRNEKEKPDPLQSYKLKKIRAAGGISFVMTPKNLDEVYKFLYNLATQRRKQ